MQCYTELTTPTAVTHSLSLPFLSPSANNLVVAKTNLLQVFSLKSVATHNQDASLSNSASGHIKREYANGPNSSLSTANRGDRLPTTKLVLVTQYELSGTITSLARVKILQSKSGGEALLVALRDAKLSLVEWDPERFSISTISIHYYEREDILSSPWEPECGERGNDLSVDPSSRCAVLRFGVRNLAIIPFHQVGDDLVMDDYDPDIDGEQLERKVPVSKSVSDAANSQKTPYAASFVLSLLALDPSLSHPIDLAFLNEYREPTFGVLHSQVASSSSLLHERQDNVSYAVYTLDLEQRASTTLLSVKNLPYDLFAVIPLSRRVGGNLLVGGNEIIHVDQSGKSNGIAVNEFARQSTSFPLADQSDLCMRLENCVVKELGLDSTELLIVLDTGELAVLSFKIDGRSVSGLSIVRVYVENGGAAMLAGSSCASIIGRGRLFIGSENADSIILGWSRKSDRLQRKRSRTDMDVDGDDDDLESEDEDVEEDEDDLYADSKPELKVQEQLPSPLTGNIGDYYFRVHDSLMNVGPMTDIALRHSSREEPRTTRSSILGSGASLLTTSGRGRAGGLTLFQQDIRANLVKQYDIGKAQILWSISIKGNLKLGSGGPNQGAYDRYIFTSSIDESAAQKSTAYRIKGDDLEEIEDVEFDVDAGETIDLDTINGGTMIAQVMQYQVRTYDGDFGLSQILPLNEDEDEATSQPKVISASLTDPYILVVRDDFSALVLTTDERGEIDDTTKVVEGHWSSGSLYEDSNDVLRLEYPEDSDQEAGNVLMFLMSTGEGLQIFRLPNVQKPVYVADGLSFLPPFLSTDFTIRRSSARESLTELLIAELGDSTHKSPYLILRSASDDLIIYLPYQSPIEGSKDTALRFLKISSPHLPKAPTENSLRDEQQERRQPLRSLHDVGCYSAVFKPGASPSFLIKSSASLPQVVDFAECSVKSLSQLHTSNCQSGFIYIDGEGKTRAAQLPLESRYETGWVTRRIALGEEVHALSYHEKKDAYVLGTSTLVDFKLPEDEFHSYWNDEDTKFPPQVEQGSVKLLFGKTLAIVDKHELEPFEVVTTIKTISLETSEHTHERQDIVAVGTAFIRGEDLPSSGHVYIFDVIDVVPEPGHPETGLALKLIAKEEVKGAVTALSGIGTQGFLLVAQGQKCMVRGLKEDGTLLPVAFMDMQCYVSVAKELPGTGMCLMADAVKGVWFSGYMEEPYQLRLFGKSPHHIEVIAGDFLPDGKQLYMVVADADCNIHILQFDPEHPKSISGTRLLHHTTFHTGHFPSTLTLLPSLLNANTKTNNDFNTTPSPILLTHQSGSLALLTPLFPSAHRTLTSLQSHLQNTLPHHAGLNPRSYRLPAEGVKGEGLGRGGVVDGNVVKRWLEGGSWRRWGGEGGDGGEVRRLLRMVRGEGLF